MGLSNWPPFHIERSPFDYIRNLDCYLLPVSARVFQPYSSRGFTDTYRQIMYSRAKGGRIGLADTLFDTIENET